MPRRRNQPSASPYAPSTSLEQVADWLTKIIVGVGLTQLNKIPRKLDSLASYIAMGMGGSASQAINVAEPIVGVIKESGERIEPPPDEDS